jgi:hypothetical protein
MVKSLRRTLVRRYRLQNPYPQPYFSNQRDIAYVSAWKSRLALKRPALQIQLKSKGLGRNRLPGFRQRDFFQKIHPPGLGYFFGLRVAGGAARRTKRKSE